MKEHLTVAGGPKEAMICIAIIEEMKARPFWKREKAWREVEQIVINNIVDPINKLIEEKVNYYGK